MLGQIQRGRVPSDYYQMLSTALSNTRIYSHALICDIGDIDNADMIGEVADLLLRHEEVDWVMCYGFCDDQMLISFRTQDSSLDAGDIARKVVDKLGTGGGHEHMAGGQITLPAAKRAMRKYSRLEWLIRRRFLNALGIRTRKGRPLVRITSKRRSKK
jgi:nanoRNase/pAp phosphatase (c-di-AMP/oligoRNAs hydrolase)